MTNIVTTGGPPWPLNAREAAMALPVLQAAHAGLRSAPPPRLATIRRLAQRCGVRDGALRTALSRACATGWLEAEGGGYRLGPLSREEAASARALLARTPGYALGVVIEGEAVDLASLREIFVRLGFRPFQRSVWIGARTPTDRLSPSLRQAGLDGAVVVFQADEVDAPARARLSRLWELEGRIAELNAFRRQLFDYLTEPGIGAVEAAWRCVEAAPVWYRVAVLGEPPFPLDLCGPDYPLESLNAAWSRRLEEMSEPLAALWSSETA